MQETFIQITGLPLNKQEYPLFKTIAGAKAQVLTIFPAAEFTVHEGVEYWQAGSLDCGRFKNVALEELIGP